MDLFISYAWTSAEHREWVRLLASQLHLLGYDVVLDKDVTYGSGLSGFMRSIQEARHVLMIADDGYVYRADSVPASGVAKENAWIREVYFDKPQGWLASLWVRNPTMLLPAWLTPIDPLTFDFRADPEAGRFPGSEQLDDLWRWLEDLPRDKMNAMPWKTQRERAARLERIANMRDPGFFRNPAVTGDVYFQYKDSRESIFRIGAGDYEFPISVSSHGHNSVYFLADHLEAVGVMRSDLLEATDLAGHLGPGRSVTPFTGQRVVLMNKQGILCTLQITGIQREVDDAYGYTPPHVAFRYTIHMDE